VPLFAGPNIRSPSVTRSDGWFGRTLNAFLEAQERAVDWSRSLREFDEPVIGGVPSATAAKRVLALHAITDAASPASDSILKWAEGTPSHLTMRLLGNTGHVRLLRDARALAALRLFVRGHPVPEESELATYANSAELWSA
jgi:hypothetical protein